MMKNWGNSRVLLGYEPNELPGCSTPQSNTNREAVLKAKDFRNFSGFSFDNQKGECPSKRRGFFTVTDLALARHGYDGREQMKGTPEIRFWAKVRKSDGCWEWTAGTQGHYGQFHVKVGFSQNAHRRSWEIHHGPIPEGMFVLHRCDNPRCVRPDHLFLGTQAENMHDRSIKGHATKKLTASAVADIKRKRSLGIAQPRIAAEYGVDNSTISNIMTGRTWRHVQP